MALQIKERTQSYADIPLIALRHSTRSVLSQSLNGTKVIPSPSNLPRDWRGLAHIAEIVYPHVNCPDPTATVLSAWEKKENITIQSLIDALKVIDRWDVIDDTAELVEKDLLEYLKILDNRNQIQVHHEELDNIVLTIDDVQCIEACGHPQYYDAFLLYDDSDNEFAMTMLYKLENEFGLKICSKERDLVGGLPFEHQAIMQLIRDRCRRLIVIISPLFLESPANKFFLTFAQALGIEQQQRKIIPCVYSKVMFPRILQYQTVLDYTRTSTLWNFWDKLSQSIRAAPPGLRALPPPRSSVSVVEISEPSTSNNVPLPVEKWECKKISQGPSVPSAPPYESDLSSLSISSPKAGPATPLSNSDSTQQKKNEISVISSNSSTVESVQSESEPFLPSRVSSTTSLLSKVFTPKRMKPKWFKKKKKVAVAL